MKTTVTFAVWTCMDGVFQTGNTERNPCKDKKPKMKNMFIEYCLKSSGKV